VVQLEPGATDPPRPFGQPPAARSAAGEPRSAIRDGWRPAWGYGRGQAPGGPRLALWPPGPHQSQNAIRRNRYDVTLLRS